MVSPGSVVSPCGGATLGILGGGESMQSHHGSPYSAFLRVDGDSEWNIENERCDWRGRICTR